MMVSESSVGSVFHVLAVKATRKPFLLGVRSSWGEAMVLLESRYESSKALHEAGLAASGVSVRIYDYPAHEVCDIGVPEFSGGAAPLFIAGGV